MNVLEPVRCDVPKNSNAKSDPRSILRLAVEEDLKTLANLCIESCDKKMLYIVIVI